MKTPNHFARTFAALSFLVAVSASTVGAQSFPTPAPLLNVEWGLQADSVIQRARVAGWTFIKIDEDGDYAFHGAFDGAEAMAFASFTGDRLTSLMINVAPHPEAARTFTALLDTLATAYGPAPVNSRESREYRAAGFLRDAAAWQGILTGLRRDGWITVVFTCPEKSSRLPAGGRLMSNS